MSGAKIRMIREMRGFSQVYIADRLGITQTSYSRLENNQTKLDTIILEKIAKELGVTSADILSQSPTIVSFSPKHDLQIDTESHYSFQKELIEKIIQSKDGEINSLKEVIAQLIKDREILMKQLAEK